MDGRDWSTAEHMIRSVHFFEQLKDLMQEVPLVNRFVYEDTMVNSDYTNMANSLKIVISYLIVWETHCM